jgi:hypothetical protein
VDKSVDPLPLADIATPVVPRPPVIPFPTIPANPLEAPALPPAPAAPVPTPMPEPAVNPLDNEQPDPAPWLVTCLQVPPPQPLLHDLPEHPHTPPAVRQLMSHFEHHPSLGAPLPPKCASRAWLPGGLAKANSAGPTHSFAIPLVDAVECALNTSISIKLKTLADVLRQPDVDKWVTAALAEIEAHLQNGTWELAQLPPGRHAISSCWVFKIKRFPDGSIDKYKGHIMAQGYSQIQGIHYNKIFASTARMAAMRTVLAIAAVEDLELESVDISTTFLNGDIDAEIYMKVPEGLRVEGDPQPGEDPKQWVVCLLKGLYGIKQGLHIWAMKPHLVLTSIGFK